MHDRHGWKRWDSFDPEAEREAIGLMYSLTRASNINAEFDPLMAACRIAVRSVGAARQAKQWVDQVGHLYGDTAKSLGLDHLSSPLG